MSPRKRSRRGASEEQFKSPAVAEAPLPEVANESRFAIAAPPVEATRPPWAPEAAWDPRVGIAALGVGALALLLRLPTLTSRSLWFDEIHTWTHVYWVPLEGFTHWLFFRIVEACMALLGHTEFGLRFYPLVAGVLGVAVTTLWIGRMAGVAPAVLGGVALAVSATHVDFSQEARYYAPMVLFAALRLWALTEFFLAGDRKRWGWLALVAVVSWMARSNHPTSIVGIAAMVLWMVGCLGATRWGRRLCLRLVTGPQGASSTRVVATSVILAGLLLIALWKGWASISSQVEPVLQKAFTLLRTGNLEKAFGKLTPEVSFSIPFFAWNFRTFGSVLPATSFLSIPAWMVYEGGFVIGLIWLVRRRTEWAVLLMLTVGLTFLSVFLYPLGQSYSPKYVAFLYPFRVLAFGVGWWVVLDWAVRRFGKWEPVRREKVALAAGLALVGILAVPALARHYTTAKTPVRPAMKWLIAHAQPSAPIVSYGHSNYGVQFYAMRLGMNLERVLLLDWPSEEGHLDLGRIRTAVPPTGDLYLVHAWPYDVPPELARGLKEEFKEVVRFRSSESKELDTIVYQWKYGPATLREDRRLGWGERESAQGTHAAADATTATVFLPLPSENQAASFYCLYAIRTEWTVETNPEEDITLSIDGKMVPLAPSEVPGRSAGALTLAPGPHTWAWARGEPGRRAPNRVVCAPATPLSIGIPATEVSRRGYQGKLEDKEFQGFPALRFVKNNWVEYALTLNPGTVYQCVVSGFDSDEGEADLEVDLDGEFAGFLRFPGESGTWVTRSFGFRARARQTVLRLRLISEAANSRGKLYPDVGAAVRMITLREWKRATPPRDDRAPLPDFLSPLPNGVPAYADPEEPDSVAPIWDACPRVFETRLVQRESPGGAGEPSLQIRLNDPYEAAVASPEFHVQPGQMFYLRVPVITDEVYNVGATLFVLLYGAEDEIYVYPSEGGLEDRIDWDYLYRAVEGPNRKEFTWLFEVPEGITHAALGIMVWPHPMPSRTPNLTVTLEPPVKPQENPNLLKR